MRIIFSRKGFDGENGGVPSPIFPDGRMISLPIPRKSQFHYGDIRSPEPAFEHLGTIIEQLTRYRMSDSCCVHLDPDLDKSMLVRQPGWRGIFGQSEAAQRELENEEVGPGDLFLFFGQFCRVARDPNGQLRYVKGAPTQHVVFGWLRIGNLYHLPEQADQVPSWAGYHAHLNYAKIEPVPNVIYIAAEKLDSNTDVPGWGVFRHFRDDLRLTHPAPIIGENGKPKNIPSRWQLPAWMNPWNDPNNPRPPLTHHRTARQWNGSDKQFATLQTVGRGQEFILNADTYPEAWPWAKAIITRRGSAADETSCASAAASPSL